MLALNKRAGRRGRLFTPAGALSVMVAMGLSSAHGQDVAGNSTNPPTDCSQKTTFDTDGDGISDSVEKNNRQANGVDLDVQRCDRDPSLPVGKPSSGRLEGGLNLPDRGAGYQHYRGSDSVDSDDWAALETLACLDASPTTSNVRPPSRDRSSTTSTSSL